MAVNCGGPRADLAHSGEPLIDGLMEAGLIRADDCRLGLDVDATSRAIAADGAPVETLFAVGPIARGHLFEITSAPDIRIRAADCASAVLGALALRSRGPTEADRGASLATALESYVTQSIDELDIELASLKFARRVRNAWELRGRRAALGDIALWLEARRGKRERRP
jgi:hypothetical protein